MHRTPIYHKCLHLLLTLTIFCSALLLPAQPGRAATPSAARPANTAAPTDRNEAIPVDIGANGFNLATLAMTLGQAITWRNETASSQVVQIQTPTNLPDDDEPTLANKAFLPVITKVSGATAAAQEVTSAHPLDTAGEVTIPPGQEVSYTVTKLGEYRFQLRDQASAMAATVTAPDHLVLFHIGNQQAALGSTLALGLQAYDPGGAPLRFNVAPLPLPDQMSLQVGNGRFAFRPTVAQTGSYTLTFSVTDGQEVASETVRITVPTPPTGTGGTSLRGRILDANTASQNVETPLVGATIRLVNNRAIAATTDSAGYFTLTGLDGGEQYVEFDGSTATPAGKYGAYRSKQVLIANVANMIDRPIYIMAIDIQGETQLDPTKTVIVNNPNISTTLTIPPRTVLNDQGALYAGPISVSEVPADFTPSSLPSNLDPGMVVTIQPMGLTFNRPAPITLPNVDNLPPGSEVDIWSMDHETARFFVAGRGQVTSDGRLIQTIEGGIRESSWHLALSPQVNPNQTPKGNVQNPGLPCGSIIALADACVHTAIDLPTYTAQGQARGVRLAYNSERAYPQPLMPVEWTLTQRSAVPGKISYEMANFGGLSNLGQIYVDTTGLSASPDKAFRSVVAVDGSALPTGVQPYEIRITNHFARSAVSAAVVGREIIVNEQASPIGAGWNVNEVSRLQEAYNGRLLLVNGDGTAQLFSPQPFDLTTWRQEGVPANGRWVVAADGASVFQTENGSPTFFVSPNELHNTTIRGTFQVEHDGSADLEGDFIGFVFGYQSPIAANGDDPNRFNFLLFSWKSRAQTFDGVRAEEGFSLSRVNGAIADYFPYFWGHKEAPEFQVLATNYGADKGWRPKAEYDFELNYSDTHLRILINNQPVFDLDGAFQPGRFGFYNFSQQEVRYKNFSATTESERFVGPEGDFSTIAKVATGAYTRRMKDGTTYHFAPNGLQTALVDRVGNRTTYAYDAQQRLTTITDPVGQATTFAYDGQRLKTITDPTGRATTFAHDGGGNLVQVTFPDNTTQQFGYDHRHLMTAETDRRGQTVTRIYDEIGRLTEVKLPQEVSRHFEPTQKVGWLIYGSPVGSETQPAPRTKPDDARTRFTDGEGRVTIYTIGPLNRPTSITDPAGFTTTITHDVNGNPLTTQLPSGARFVQSYDGQGNLLTFTDQTVNGVTRYSYENTFNQLTSSTDPLGNVTRLAYDTQGNLVRAHTPLSRTMQLSYNAQGLPITMIDPLGATTALRYDANGNPSQVTVAAEAEQRTTTFTYTPTGDPATITDPLGQQYRFAYDAWGRLSQETLPSATPGERTVGYQYDGEGNLTTLTPPGRPAHSFEYDALGLVTAYIPPTVADVGAVRTTYAYNKAQQLTQVTRPDGKQLTYSYDNGGRLATLGYSRGALTFGYAANSGHLNSVTAPAGVNLGYSYNGELLTGVTWSGPVAGAVGFTYDANYRLMQERVNGAAITYGYDADSALTQAGDLTLTYSATTGLLTGSTLGSISDRWGYNGFGEPTSYTAAQNGAALYAIRYERDALGRITGQSETIDGVTSNYRYGYDAAQRLAQVEKDGVVVEQYSYDANGNRLTGLSPLTGNVTGAYDDQDRLLQYGAATYRYTANGELLTKTQNGQTTHYNYDELGNLTAVTLPDGTQITYLVDGQNRRIGKQVNGNLVQGWLYQDQLRPLAEVDGAGNVVSRFVYGMRVNVPEYMVKGGVTYRLISDHLGSVRLVVNAQSGEIVQRLAYDAFGNVLQDSNPGFQPFGFAGGLYDAATGLVRFGARDYDAVAGRWTAKDPIGFSGGDGNLYAYSANNPVNLADPTGLDTITYGGTINVPGFLIDLGQSIFGGENIPGGRSLSVGIAISFPGFFGGEFDYGVFGEVGISRDLGIQGKFVEEFGYHRGSVCDLAGHGYAFSVHYVTFGGSIYFDANGHFTGISINFGPGIGVSGDYTIGETLSRQHFPWKISQ
jgi:RHS repeat-associated protein